MAESTNGFAAMLGESVDDTPLAPEDHPQESAQHFILSLDTADKPFLQTDTFSVFVPKYGRTVDMPIHTVSEKVFRAAIQECRPLPPKARNRAGQAITDDDELQAYFPHYRQAIREWNDKLGYIMILLGTDGLQLFEQGVQVWPFQGRKRDWLAAARALEDMGTGQGQFIAWFRAIQNLGEAKSPQEQAVFLDSSEPN